MIFNTIFYEWDEIPLQHPIDVAIQSIDHSYTIDYKPLDLLVSGISHLDCEVEFQDKLDLVYEMIGLEMDKNLMPSTQKIKQRILWHVGVNQSQTLRGFHTSTLTQSCTR